MSDYTAQMMADTGNGGYGSPDNQPQRNVHLVTNVENRSLSPKGTRTQIIQRI